MLSLYYHELMGKIEKHEMDYYILRTFLLVTILLLMIAINCYHFAKHRSKQENVDALAI